MIAVDASYPPNEFLDSANNFAGWEIELFHALGAKLGLTPVFRQVTFADIIPRVVAGTYDIGLSSFFDIPERQALVDLVDYYSAGILWAQRAGEPPVDPSNACGLTVAAQAGTYQATHDLPERNEKCLSQSRAPITIIGYTTQSDATEALVEESSRLDSAVVVASEPEVDWPAFIALMSKSIPAGGKIKSLNLVAPTAIESTTLTAPLNGEPIVVTAKVTLSSPTFVGVEYFLLDARQWPGYSNTVIDDMNKTEGGYEASVTISFGLGILAGSAGGE